MLYVFILIAAALIYFFFIFPTQWLKVERNRFPCGLGVRILQISDLHVEKLRIGPKRLSKRIAREKPDIIFLTGDYTRDHRYLPKVRRYVQAISSHGIPVFAVLGNHDHHMALKHLNELVRIFEQTGIQVLSNRTVSAGSFQIVGIDDFGSKKSKIGKAFTGVDPAKPILVLTHNPNLVLRINRDYTLLMAGHFHGMQFNVPFLFRFVNKGALAAVGIYKGLHSREQGSFYISKGIGQAGINARFLVRSEITIHEL